MRILYFMLMVFMSGCSGGISHSIDSEKIGSIHDRQDEEAVDSPNAVMEPIVITIEDSREAKCRSLDECYQDIYIKVANSWIRPPSAKKGLVALFVIELLDAKQARISAINGSGNFAFDKSCFIAIQKSFIYPEIIRIKELDSKFRILKLKFNPNDLSG